MCSKLGVGVMAEGVETTEQHDLLKQMHCPYAQGYLYDRPMPVEAFVQRYLAGAAPAR